MGDGGYFLTCMLIIMGGLQARGCRLGPSLILASGLLIVGGHRSRIFLFLFFVVVFFALTFGYRLSKMTYIREFKSCYCHLKELVFGADVSP